MWLEILVLLIIVISTIKFLFKKRNDRNFKKKIPGPNPSDPENGNWPEIDKLSLKVFLKKLHDTYGPIASFWEGKTMAVSVASPEYLKKQRHLTIRPKQVLGNMEILIGGEAIALQNGEVAKRKRKIYHEFFTSQACNLFAQCFAEIACEYTDKWKKLKDGVGIPVVTLTQQISMKAILRTFYGNYFKDEENFLNFFEEMKYVVMRLESMKHFEKGDLEEIRQRLQNLRRIGTDIMRKRRKEIKIGSKELLIDILINEDEDTEDQCISNVIGFIFAGYSTTGYSIFWLLYELCKNLHIQEKLFQELKRILGKDQVTAESLKNLTYLRQVINESLRIHPGAEYMARINDEEMNLDGYIIPKNTVIYQPFGVVFHDPNIWPNPERFDPDRFTPEAVKSRHPYAFQPFGFAGKRVCTGMTYAYTEIMIYLAEWCRHFKFHLLPEQKVEAIHGITPVPKYEVLMTLEKRLD